MSRPLLRISRVTLVMSLLSLAIVMLGCAAAPITSATPTATPTVPSPTETVTPSPTASSSATPTPTSSPSTSATPTASPAPQPPQPSVVIVSPLYNIGLPPGDIKVTVKVSNFTIADKIGQPSVAGEGHLIYYFDVNPPTDAGNSAATAAGTFAETVATSYTWPGVAAGSHKIAVQLVNNDGTPLNPPVIAGEPVPVAAPTPTASSTPSPTPSP